MKLSRHVIMSAASLTLLAAAINASAAGPGAAAASTQDREASTAFKQFMQNGQKPNQAAPLWDTKAATGNCAAAATTCGFASVGLVLSCAASVYSLGTLTPACATLFTATGGACSLAAGYCAQRDWVPPVRRLTGVADVVVNSPDFASEKKCAARQHVSGMRFEWRSGASTAGRITKVTLTCTGGGTLTWGYNGDTSAYSVNNCGTGRLLAGMQILASTEINKIGPTCRDAVGTNETLYPGAFSGGTAGTRQDRTCPANEHVIGAKFHMDGATESLPNLIGVELLCGA